MALNTFQIVDEYRSNWNAGVRRFMKNQRNRKIRRVPADELPDFKYRGW